MWVFTKHTPGGLQDVDVTMINESNFGLVVTIHGEDYPRLEGPIACERLLPTVAHPRGTLSPRAWRPFST
ncbi:hypothetical protein DESC_810080 [Desulfosarcina cetonica]|nr:hypothetical protein DESC_810080 [Desulfosarcina cetonica]